MKARLPISIFLVICVFSSAGAQTIVRAEYFIDIDPGVGNGTPITIASPSDNVTFTAAIPTTGIDPGYHILFIRTKSSDDVWSLYEYREFVIDVPLQQAEYFFDEDPGIGNGFSLTIPPAQMSFSSTIPTAGLGDGEHVLFIRTRQADRWSLAEPIAFYIHARITAAEYFIDTDPGFGNGTALMLGSPSADLTLSANVAVGVLGAGVHYLFVRTKDIFGNWSLYDVQQFTMDPALPVELADLRATVSEDQNVVITWKTLSERISSYFSVTHSEDGKRFSEIARVPAAGESKILRNYSMLDNNPVAGYNYYQLKMVDMDGATAFSNVVAALVMKNFTPEVYPNPVDNELFIDRSKSEFENPCLIELIDLNGKMIRSITTSHEKVLRMTREGINDGVYVLRITSAKSIDIYKLIFSKTSN